MDNNSRPNTPTSTYSDFYDDKLTLSLAISAALHDFDGIKLSTILRSGVDIKPEYFSTPLLHELANYYSATSSRNRPVKLVTKCVDIVSLLIENGIDINETDSKQQTVLHIIAACPGDNSEFLNRIIDMGAIVNHPDLSMQIPLHRAVITGSIENAKCLLLRKADPNLIDFGGISPIHLAAKKKGGKELLQLFLESGGEINLHRPTWERDQKQRQKANHTSYSCSTPLHVAARFCRIENLKFLVEKGANCTIEDNCGRTALHIAAANDLTGDCCKVLLQANPATCNLKDILKGETPLHCALTAGNVDAALYLVKNRADVKLQDFWGKNALHKAVRHIQSQSLWSAMLKDGSPDQEDCDGFSARVKATNSKNKIALAEMQLSDSRPKYEYFEKIFK